jgi:hypothetical protein
MSFEDAVDEHIAQRIVYWMGGPYFSPALRETSRGCAAMIPAPPKVRDMREIARIYIMIGDLAKCRAMIARDCGFEFLKHVIRWSATYDRRDILELALGSAKGRVLKHKRDAMFHAASCGNRELCEFILARYADDKTRANLFARMMSGAACANRIDLFAKMMSGAACANRIDLFELALKLSEECAMPVTNFDESMSLAARAGHAGMCRFILGAALSRGRHINMDIVLRNAARGGSKEICELARVNGARDFEEMLRGAAEGGNIEMCKFAREWLDTEGPYDAAVFYNMMIGTISELHFDAFRLAHEWWTAKLGRDLNIGEIYNAIVRAAIYGSLEICEFLWNATLLYESAHHNEETEAEMVLILDVIMSYSVIHGHVALCELIHTWGAEHYERYLASADDADRTRRAHKKEKLTDGTRELIKKWMAERDIAQ